MMLSEEKTYRTRDGSRTGIRVERLFEPKGKHHFREKGGAGFYYTEDGFLWYDKTKDNDLDLIEEQPADRPFSYDACPVHADGRRRAVTRDGREVVLLCNDAPAPWLILGWIIGNVGPGASWDAAGVNRSEADSNLLIPPPPKRVVWVNLPPQHKYQFNSEWAADRHNNGMPRLGNRAYPIEIDEALR